MTKILDTITYEEMELIEKIFQCKLHFGTSGITMEIIHAYVDDDGTIHSNSEFYNRTFEDIHQLYNQALLIDSINDIEEQN